MAIFDSASLRRLSDGVPYIDNGPYKYIKAPFYTPFFLNQTAGLLNNEREWGTELRLEVPLYFLMFRFIQNTNPIDGTFYNSEYLTPIIMNVPLVR